MIDAKTLDEKTYISLRNQWLKNYAQYHRYIIETKEKITFEEYCKNIAKKNK